MNRYNIIILAVLALLPTAAVLSHEIPQPLQNLRGGGLSETSDGDTFGGLGDGAVLRLRDEQEQDPCEAARRARIVACTNNCVNRSGGSKTRYQCRMQCSANRNGGGGGKDSVGPGKYSTVAPTPTPPSREHIICINNCTSKGGSIEFQRSCKAKCPVPEFDLEIC